MNQNIRYDYFCIFLVSLILISACSSSVRFSKKSAVPAKTTVRENDRPKKGDSDLYQEASSWIGVPYRYGGMDRSGIDCSGLAGIIYQEVYHISLPRTVDDLVDGGKPISGRHFREGDLLFFKNTRTGPADHVGIYLGGDKFIHASTSSGVIISDFEDEFYRKKFITARRYLD
jgi:lipoprotein Spr